MATFTAANGKMVSSMDEESFRGQMASNTTETGPKENVMDLALA